MKKKHITNYNAELASNGKKNVSMTYWEPDNILDYDSFSLRSLFDF